MKYKVTVEYEFEADELDQAIHFSKDLKKGHNVKHGRTKRNEAKEPFYYVNVTRSNFELKEIQAKN
jgi:hypothetical protein